MNWFDDNKTRPLIWLAITGWMAAAACAFENVALERHFQNMYEIRENHEKWLSERGDRWFSDYLDARFDATACHARIEMLRRAVP